MLEAKAHPAVGFVMAAETPRGDGVGKYKELPLGADGRVQSLDQKLELVVEHRVEPRAAHIASAGPVNGIAERHIVCGDRFGDRSRSPSRRKKPSRDLLSRADFRKRSIDPAVHVDFKCLLPHLLVESLCHGAGH